MHYCMFINGEWVDTDDHYEIVNPATGDVEATLAKGDLSHVDRAVDAAQHAFNASGWRHTGMSERAELLERVAQAIAERAAELSVSAARENGTPVRLAQALSVGFPVAHINHYAALARHYVGERVVTSTQDTAEIIRREPLGVVAGIVPWNFPLLLAVWKTMPAIAAGNSVVLKVDEKTPIGTLLLAGMLQESGLPAGVFNVVTGDGPSVGGYLSAHPKVRKVSFTGSTATGKSVMRSAAENVKQLTLELGGKGANIVLDDADLELAVDGALWAFLAHAGQACESGTRLLIHESIHDEFLERLVRRAGDLRVGDPLDPSSDIGPVMNARQRERILDYVTGAEAEGARVVFRGTLPESLSKGGYWVPPTIFSDVTPDMRIAYEEIFGPVLAVLRFKDDDEAVSIANGTEYGLSAGVWSIDRGRAMTVATRLEVGTVWINDWHNLSGNLPFGGYKQSGFGRELGPHALDEFTQEKAICLDMSSRDSRVAWGLVLPVAEQVPVKTQGE